MGLIKYHLATLVQAGGLKQPNGFTVLEQVGRNLILFSMKMDKVLHGHSDPFTTPDQIVVNR